MKKIIVFTLITMLSVPPAFGQSEDYNGFAIARAQATWATARSWAHYLAASDLLNTLGLAFAAVDTHTYDNRENLEGRMNDLISKFGQIAKAPQTDSKVLKDLTKKYLKTYQELIKTEFILSWDVLERQYDSQFLKKYLQTTVQNYEAECKVGRSSPMAEVEIPGIELPSLGVGITLSPNLQTYVWPSIHFSSGAKSDWERSKDVLEGGVGAATTIIANASKAANTNIYTAIIVAVIFAVVNKFAAQTELDHMQASLADAEHYYFAERAHAGDISKLYREYCGAASKGLSHLLAILSLDEENEKKAIAYAHSPAFNKKLTTWVAAQDMASQATCRTSLQDNFKSQGCSPFSAPVKPLHTVEEPSCKRFNASKNLTASEPIKCPTVIVNQDNFCRISSDGAKLVNIQSATKGDLPLCEIPLSGYENSSNHITDLKLAGREREAKYIEDAPIREASRKKHEEEKANAIAELTKVCMAKPVEANTPPPNLAYCTNSAKSQVEQWDVVTDDQRKAMRTAELKAQEADRARNREILGTKASEASEILGYYTLLKLSDHAILFQELKEREHYLKASRDAAELRLLSLMRTIDIGSSLTIPRDTSGYEEFLVLQRDFIRLSAKAIQNVMLGVSNKKVVLGYLDLNGRYEGFYTKHPTGPVTGFGDSVKEMIDTLVAP